MQLPSSTPVSDPALVALPLPAPLSSISGEIPSGIRSESSGGFESLIAQLTPSAAPRLLTPVAGRAASQPSVRAGSAVKQPGSFVPASDLITPPPLGFGANASFFLAGAPETESATDQSAMPELPPLPEKRLPATETPLNASLPDAPLPQPEALLPLMLAASEQKPGVADQETATFPGDMGIPEPVASPSSAAGEASARGKRGAYLKSGDHPAIHARAAEHGEFTEGPTGSGNVPSIADSPTTDKTRGIADVDAKFASSGQSAVTVRPERPSDDRLEEPLVVEGTNDFTESTGRNRAAVAVATAQRGPAGVVAQGVPFLGSDQVNPQDATEDRVPLRAVRAAAAKFAVVEADSKLPENSARNTRNKTFLDADKESVVDIDKSIGTAIAKLEASMVSRFTSSSQTHPGSDYTGDRVSAPSAAGETRPDISSAESVVSTAGEAVEAVLQAADRITSREQRSVNLNFSVGDAQLAVRVELHGEEVRTSFRTDSPELRAALAEEWSARAAGGDTILRFAAPSITGSNTTSANEFSERSPQQQHEREPRRSDYQPEFMRPERPRAEPVLIPAAQSATPGSRLTSHRLLSFA